MPIDREKLIQGCIDYFRSNQWKDLMQLIQERDMCHIHIWVDMSIHPYESFTKLIKGYLEMSGWPIYREIMRLRNRPGVVVLYGVNIRDKAHFDLFGRYNPDVAIAPMPPLLAERGRNLLPIWDHDVERFQRQFKFRDLGPREEADVKTFFEKGEQWQQFCKYVQDPDIMHVHCNVETSVNPEVLRKYAVENLKSRGWTLAHAIHCLFYGDNKANGKVIFLGLNPARTYDIAWYYNPDVLLQPNAHDARMVGDEGTNNRFYLMRLSALEKELPMHDWAVLTDDEIKRILEATKDFDALSPNSWRRLPVQ